MEEIIKNIEGGIKSGIIKANSKGEFREELAELINKHSIENKCDMPDFLLAEMMVNVINSIGLSVKKTLDWHGCDSVCHPKEKPMP